MADYDREPSFPDIPQPLLERLEKMYPDRAPDLTLSDREAWGLAYQATLVRKLREQFKQQSERTMKRNR